MNCTKNKLNNKKSKLEYNKKYSKMKERKR